MGDWGYVGGCIPQTPWIYVSFLEAENVFQAHHQPRLLHRLPDAADYSGHIAVPAQGVVAQGDGLSGGAEYHLVVGAPSGHPDAVDGYAAKFAAAGAGQVFLFGDVAGELLAVSQALGQRDGEAGGGVNLASWWDSTMST